MLFSIFNSPKLCGHSSLFMKENMSTEEGIFTGQVLVKCKNKVFIGIWHQTGNEGFGVAQSEAGIKLDFTFSNNRKDAVASIKKKKKESRETKKIVELKEKNYETKDSIKPVITVFYNQDKFVSTKDKKAILEFDIKNYELLIDVNLEGTLYCIEKLKDI